MQPPAVHQLPKLLKPALHQLLSYIAMQVQWAPCVVLHGVLTLHPYHERQHNRLESPGLGHEA